MVARLNLPMSYVCDFLYKAFLEKVVVKIAVNVLHI